MNCMKKSVEIRTHYNNYKNNQLILLNNKCILQNLIKVILAFINTFSNNNHNNKYCQFKNNQHCQINKVIKIFIKTIKLFDFIFC